MCYAEWQRQSCDLLSTLVLLHQTIKFFQINPGCDLLSTLVLLHPAASTQLEWREL